MPRVATAPTGALTPLTRPGCWRARKRNRLSPPATFIRRQHQSVWGAELRPRERVDCEEHNEMTNPHGQPHAHALQVEAPPLPPRQAAAASGLRATRKTPGAHPSLEVLRRPSFVGPPSLPRPPPCPSAGTLCRCVCGGGLRATQGPWATFPWGGGDGRCVWTRPQVIKASSSPSLPPHP